ncbi:MAG: hypothetical protein WCL11_20140, partial [Verrucomicrobiota bacterium]
MCWCVALTAGSPASSAKIACSAWDTFSGTKRGSESFLRKAHAPAFVKDVLGMMIANRGDDLPVSALPVDGTFPTGTTQY